MSKFAQQQVCQRSMSLFSIHRVRTRIRTSTCILLFISLFTAISVVASAQTLSLFGSLRSANGAEPIAGARLFVRQGAAEPIGPALSDSYGRYAFYDISPGRYHLTVYVHDAKRWDVEVTVPGDLAPIVIPLT